MLHIAKINSISESSNRIKYFFSFDAKVGGHVLLKEQKCRYTNSFYLSHYLMLKDTGGFIWKRILWRPERRVSSSCWSGCLPQGFDLQEFLTSTSCRSKIKNLLFISRKGNMKKSDLKENRDKICIYRLGEAKRK